MLEHKQTDNVLIQEYVHHKWALHVKGLWYYSPNEPLPSLTLIGSPNFGHCSVHQDLQAQVAIVIADQELGDTFHEEKTHLYSRVQQVICETFEWSERIIPVWVYCVVPSATFVPIFQFANNSRFWKWWKTQHVVMNVYSGVLGINE